MKQARKLEDFVDLSVNEGLKEKLEGKLSNIN